VSFTNITIELIVLPVTCLQLQRHTVGNNDLPSCLAQLLCLQEQLATHGVLRQQTGPPTQQTRQSLTDRQL
jgi:hypothetical protein